MPDKIFTPITSSMLSGYHYDPDSRVLTVRYTSGAEYAHDDVSAEKVHALEGNVSPGRFFNAHIRDNHPGRKV